MKNSITDFKSFFGLNSPDFPKPHSRQTQMWTTGSNSMRWVPHWFVWESWKVTILWVFFSLICCHYKEKSYSVIFVFWNIFMLCLLSIWHEFVNALKDHTSRHFENIFFLRHAKRPKATFYVKNIANICQIRKSRNRSLLKPGWKTVWKI